MFKKSDLRKETVEIVLKTHCTDNLIYVYKSIIKNYLQIYNIKDGHPQQNLKQCILTMKVRKLLKLMLGSTTRYLKSRLSILCLQPNA